MKKIKIIIILVVIILLTVTRIKSKEKENVQYIENTNETLNTKIVLYFSNLETKELVKEYRYVNIKDIKENMPETIIKELLKGPTSEDLTSSIPKDTKVNYIKEKDGKIEIDFSKEYEENSRRWYNKPT